MKNYVLQARLGWVPFVPNEISSWLDQIFKEARKLLPKKRRLHKKWHNPPPELWLPNSNIDLLTRKSFEGHASAPPGVIGIGEIGIGEMVFISGVTGEIGMVFKSVEAPDRFSSHKLCLAMLVEFVRGNFLSHFEARVLLRRRRARPSDARAGNSSPRASRFARTRVSPPRAYRSARTTSPGRARYSSPLEASCQGVPFRSATIDTFFVKKKRHITE